MQENDEIVKGVLELHGAKYGDYIRDFCGDPEMERIMGWLICSHSYRADLVPNSMGPIFVTVTFLIPQAIFYEAFLSFIGIGISAPQASLGARRSVRRCTVSGFGLFDLRRIAGAYLDIGQAHLGLAVTQVCQLLVILLRGDGVATLKRFIGQALIGQAGTAGQGDGQQT